MKSGEDPTGKLLNGLLTTLNSLEDTNGIIQAMKIYGEEYYNRLIFWRWIHHISAKMYHQAYMSLQTTSHLEKNVNIAINFDHTKNRELLLRLFHFMVNHYHGSSWSKMVKTLITYKPYLKQALSQLPKDQNGNFVKPDPKIQSIMQQYGTNGQMSLSQLNNLVKDNKN